MRPRNGHGVIRNLQGTLLFACDIPFNLPIRQVGAYVLDEAIKINTRLQNAVLTGVELNYFNLSNIDLRGSQLIDCLITYSNLHSINLERAHLINTKIEYCNLTRADMRNIILNNSVITCSNLSQSLSDGIHLINSRSMYNNYDSIPIESPVYRSLSSDHWNREWRNP